MPRCARSATISAGVCVHCHAPDYNCPTGPGYSDMGQSWSYRGEHGGKADVILAAYGGLWRRRWPTGFALDEMAMVGDRLYTDVATGVNHGMTGILVLSGRRQGRCGRRDVKPT
jgi:hypothetical protein